METRELKDLNGDVIVSLSLPIGTSEQKWAEVLSSYIIAEPQPEENTEI